MSITRYSGGNEYHSLRREMDRLLESFFPRTEDSAASAMWVPRADLAETDDAFVVSMDLPGVKPEEVEVTFEDGSLKVTGERSAERKHEGRHFHRIERSYGRFFRAFRFGHNADPESISADYRDGILTIQVGKREASKPRRIEIGRSSDTEERTQERELEMA
jgi:HSP20 family protein